MSAKSVGLRVLKVEGLRAYYAFLQDLLDEKQLDPPDILQDDKYSAPIPGFESTTITAPQGLLSSKLHLAKYLDAELSSLTPTALRETQGLWSWLSLFLFEQLSPKDSAGERPRLLNTKHVYTMEHRSKPDPDYYLLKGEHPGALPNVRRQYMYRHLLFMPFRLYRNYKGTSSAFVERLVLGQPIGIHGERMEQLGSRVDRWKNPAYVGAVEEVLMDKTTGALPAGVLGTNRDTPGTLRRVQAVIRQLDTLYDTYGMPIPDLVSKLPADCYP